MLSACFRKTNALNWPWDPQLLNQLYHHSDQVQIIHVLGLFSSLSPSKGEGEIRTFQTPKYLWTHTLSCIFVCFCMISGIVCKLGSALCLWKKVSLYIKRALALIHLEFSKLISFWEFYFTKIYSLVKSGYRETRVNGSVDIGCSSPFFFHIKTRFWGPALWPSG